MQRDARMRRSLETCSGAVEDCQKPSCGCARLGMPGDCQGVVHRRWATRLLAHALDT